MKKLVILTTSLLLVSGGINATETLNKLIETKVETSMSAPAPLPIVPVGTVTKLVFKSFKAAIKLIDEMPYHKILCKEELCNDIKSLFKIDPKDMVKFLDKDEMIKAMNKVMGGAVLQDMMELNLTVMKNADLEKIGGRAKELMEKLGDDIIKTRQNLEDFYMLTRDGYNGEAIAILDNLKKGKTITLDKLASQVRTEFIIKKKGKKINLGSAKNKANKNLKALMPKWKDVIGTKYNGKFKINTFINKDGNLLTEKYLARKPMGGIISNSGDQIFKDLLVPQLLKRTINDGSARYLDEIFKNGKLSRRFSYWSDDDVAKKVGFYDDTENLVKFIKYDSERNITIKIEGEDIKGKDFFELIEN